MDDRNTLIKIDGIRNDSNITEDIVNQVLREFEHFLLENVFGCGEIHEGGSIKGASKKGACYIATSVYGSYDCSQLWTLRRYRDGVLSQSWYGRAFIRTYYAISPTIVRLFGHTVWFNRLWRGKLDKMVEKLQTTGYDASPYNDIFV